VSHQYNNGDRGEKYHQLGFYSAIVGLSALVYRRIVVGILLCNNEGNDTCAHKY